MVDRHEHQDQDNVLYSTHGTEVSGRATTALDNTAAAPIGSASLSERDGKKRKVTYWVWGYFDLPVRTLCAWGTPAMFSSTNGTGTLDNHLSMKQK